MTSALLFVFAGTLGAAVIPDEELIRTVNTFMNFLTIALLVYQQRKVGPKVDKIEESTKNLGDWNGSERRDLEH